MNATTVIAICALVVSVFSTGLAVWTAFLQRQHMRLSVRPIASVQNSDYEDFVGVSIRNKGLGPMYIESVEVINRTGNVQDRIISHMPTLQPGTIWTTFLSSVDGSTLEAGSSFELLQLKGDPTDSSYAQSRNNVRKSLAELTIKIQYQDLYGNRMEPHEESLLWFGRHFS